MMMPPRSLSPKTLMVFAGLGLVLVAAGLYLFFTQPSEMPPSPPENAPAGTEAALGPDPCVTELIDAEIVPCQVLVYFKADAVSSLDEVQRQELIDELISTSQIPVTSYRFLPSPTEVILSLSTPIGKEEQIGQQMVETFPAYVDRYQTLENIPMIFN
jgi:hypothetical protein